MSISFIKFALVIVFLHLVVNTIAECCKLRTNYRPEIKAEEPSGRVYVNSKLVYVY